MFFQGNPWQQVGWSYNSGTGIWTSNPRVGTEVLLNNTFDADTNWTKGTGWSIAGGKATHVAGTAGNLYQNVAVAHTWYQLTFDIVNWTAGDFLGQIAGVNSPAFNALGRYVCTGKGAAATICVRAQSTAAGSIDNAYCKPLVFSDCLALRNYGQQVAPAVKAIITAGIQAGVIARCVPDRSSFLLCYHNRTNLIMESYTAAGGYVSLVSAAAAYADNAVVEIRFSAANTAQAFYNGVQIGVDQNVAALPAGNYAGMFAPYSTVQLKDFMTTP